MNAFCARGGVRSSNFIFGRAIHPRLTSHIDIPIHIAPNLRRQK